MAKVVLLKPASGRDQRAAFAAVADAVLHLPSDRISDAERSITARTLARCAEAPEVDQRFWTGTYSMLNRAQTAAAWKAIDALPGKCRPRQVRRVFDQVILNMGFDTGEVPLTREQIAEAAGCLPREVSSAMVVLEEIGVIVRNHERVSGMRGRGKAVYAINPHVAWTGDLEEARERAKQSKAAPLPLFAVIDGGRFL